MSSRQEEKERRKRERLERERAEAAAQRRQRLLMVAGAVAGGVVVLVLALVLATGGDDKPEGPSSQVSGGATIPARQISDLDEAVKAAGCAVRTFPEEGREHIADNKSFDGYKTNPPTSGTHRQTPAQDGIYDAGSEPDPENWIHTLEHGRIILMYKPGTPKRTVDQLQTLFNEKVKGGPNGYHLALLANNTKMTYQVAAVAWRHYAVCNRVTDRTWDALRAFRDRYVDTAPEKVP